MTEFSGVIVPIITPFADGGEIDFAALRENIDALIAGGVHGILPAGSTGEAMCLRPDEYHDLLETTIDHVAGRVPVVAGCSANATRDVIANCMLASELGADGYMVTHPYYSRPDDHELLEHYRALSATLNRPLIVYNNPYTTGVDASAELLDEIGKLPYIRHVKESSGDATRVERLILLSGGRVRVLCGTDNLALESLTAGACGWVAGAANALPRECVQLYDLAVEQHKNDEALILYRALYSFLDLAESTGKFVQVNKAAVEFVGRTAGPPRLPLQPLDEAQLEKMRSALSQLLGRSTETRGERLSS